MTIYVDLMGGKYCFDDCKSAYSFKSRIGDRITFYDARADGLYSDGSPMKDVSSWDRSTGEYLREYAYNGRVRHEGEERAHCMQAK